MEFQEDEIEFLNGIEMEEEKSTPSKGSSIIPFIQTLYAILQEKSNEEYIMWTPEDNGKTFFIKDAIVFSKELLPKYYKHTNFCGFARQLSLYGFKKYDDEYKYENEYFQKDKFELLKNIQRRKPQSQRKKQNNTSNLYHDLLSQLMSLQKQNLDTIGQINTLKELLFQLKLREENLEMKMQRLQDTILIGNNNNNNNTNPFGNDNDLPFLSQLNSNIQNNSNNTNQQNQNNNNNNNNTNTNQNNTQTNSQKINNELQRMLEESIPPRENQRNQRDERSQLNNWNASHQNPQIPWKL